MSRPLSRLSTATALGAVLAVAGCGGSGGTPATPQGELVASVSKLGEAGTVTTTIQLQTTAAALKGIARAGGNTLSADAANGLVSAQLVIETQKGGGGHSAFAVRAIDGGQTLVELRVVGDTIYLQGDVNAILTLAHKRSDLASLQTEAAQLPPFAKALLDGKWVSLNAAALSGLAGQVGGPTGSADASQGPRLLAELKGVLSRDVTVTKLGTDSRGDHLMVTGDANKLAADIKSSIASSVPGGGALTDRLTVGAGSSRVVTLEAWVKDGALTELSLDLAQFAPKDKVPGGATLPLTMTFDQSGDDISAPAGAVSIDLTQLGGLLSVLTGSSSVSGGSPAG
jgi:hypothetical protein